MAVKHPFAVLAGWWRRHFFVTGKFESFPRSNQKWNLFASVAQCLALLIVLGTTISPENDTPADNVPEWISLTRTTFGATSRQVVECINLGGPGIFQPVVLLIMIASTMAFEFYYSYTPNLTQHHITVVRFFCEYPISVTAIGLLMHGVAGVRDFYGYLIPPLIMPAAMMVGSGYLVTQPKRGVRQYASWWEVGVSTFLVMLSVAPLLLSVFLGDPPDFVYALTGWIFLCYSLYGMVAVYKILNPSFNDHLAYTVLSFIVKNPLTYTIVFNIYKDPMAFAK